MILPSEMCVILQINSHFHVGILFLVYKLYSHDIIFVNKAFLAPILIIELHLPFDILLVLLFAYSELFIHSVFLNP